jgi:hypothetical protein
VLITDKVNFRLAAETRLNFARQRSLTPADCLHAATICETNSHSQWVTLGLSHKSASSISCAVRALRPENAAIPLPSIRGSTSRRQVYGITVNVSVVNHESHCVYHQPLCRLKNSLRSEVKRPETVGLRQSIRRLLCP